MLRKAPPLPFLPAEVHGKEVLVFAVCAVGDMQKAEKAVAPLRALGKPIADVVGPHPFAGWQTAFDPLLTPGARNYWKSHDFKELDDGFDRRAGRRGAAACRPRSARSSSATSVGRSIACPPTPPPIRTATWSSS